MARVSTGTCRHGKFPPPRGVLFSEMDKQEIKRCVRGVELDAETRCLHYHSVLDIIAIKMMCCGDFYACTECHEALADHPIEVWPVDRWDQRAILCGHCGEELSIAEYMTSGYACPTCDAAFNPGCRNHYRYYLGTGSEPSDFRDGSPVSTLR